MIIIQQALLIQCIFSLFNRPFVFGILVGYRFLLRLIVPPVVLVKIKAFILHLLLQHNHIVVMVLLDVVACGFGQNLCNFVIRIRMEDHTRPFAACVDQIPIRVFLVGLPRILLIR